MTFADKVIRFNESLQLDVLLPEGIEVMNPFANSEVTDLSNDFYKKYYDDHQPRKLILGINPGRLGAGVTGIPFTDPVKLEELCGINNTFKKVTEPSAGFVYDFIDAMGGPNAFYARFFINSVSPLIFIKDKKNYNYYDSRDLEQILETFIVDSLRGILKMGINTENCYCLGNGKNFKYLKKLNNKYQFFETIVPLPHPRWVVQYRRKQYDEFVSHFYEVLS